MSAASSPPRQGSPASSLPSTANPDQLRTQLFYPENDGPLFDEAVRCYRHGAYRAALVMTWLAVAEGIRHRFEVASERDAELTALVKELREREGKREAIDSLLLDKARSHRMISAHEKRELAHIRDQRNQYAHPSGTSPTPMQVLAALEAAVRIVLSRPALHRKEWAAALVKQAASERTFFPRDPEGLRDYTRQIDALLTEEAREHLLHTAFGMLDGLARDPSRSDLAENVILLAATILELHPELVTALDCAGRLARRQLGAALVCLQPHVFKKLDVPLAGAAVASILEPPVGPPPDWQPDVRALVAVQKLESALLLNPAWLSQLRRRISALPLNELVALDIEPKAVARRLVEELVSGDWHRQNLACRALANLGPDWLANLSPDSIERVRGHRHHVLQTALGCAVTAAAEGDAVDAEWLLGRISRTARQWPNAFIRGIAVECFFSNEDSRFQLKAAAQAKVEAILAARGDGDQLIAQICDLVTEFPGRPTKQFLDELKLVVDRRPSPLFTAVSKRLSKATAGS